MGPDPTRPEAIFFDPRWKKLKNLTFLGEIFKIQTQTINGRPEPQKIDPARPGSKIFDPDPSLPPTGLFINIEGRSSLISHVRESNMDR